MMILEGPVTLIPRSWTNNRGNYPIRIQGWPGGALNPVLS